MKQKFIVIAIHGEGDRATVNALQEHRNAVEVHRLQQASVREIPAMLTRAPDEPPDVIVILRDLHHDFRIEWPVRSWAEVERWKDLAGYDEKTRHWQHGATVEVSIR
jgi:hypothetical protein